MLKKRYDTLKNCCVDASLHVQTFTSAEIVMNINYNFPTVRVRLILDPLFGLFFDKRPEQLHVKIKWQWRKVSINNKLSVIIFHVIEN